MLFSRLRLLFVVVGLSIAFILPPAAIASGSGISKAAVFQEGWYPLLKVLNGDTIRVQGLNNDVFLAGIDAPEINMQYGPEAANTLKWLLNQSDYPTWVYLEPAYPNNDPYGRYRAHVWFYSSSWGGWQLTQGYLAGVGLATVDRYAPYKSDLYYEYLAQMEGFAYSNHCGLWGGKRC